MGNPITILIIDDTPGIAALISRAIQNISPSAHILVANNGQEGVLLALQHYPNLIITDLELAEMDGYELIRILRHEKYGNQIRVIGMTGRDSSVVRSNKFRMLCNEFLLKPFSLNEIREKVSTVLGFEKPQGSVQASADFLKDVLRNGTLG